MEYLDSKRVSDQRSQLLIYIMHKRQSQTITISSKDKQRKRKKRKKKNRKERKTYTYIYYIIILYRKPLQTKHSIFAWWQISSTIKANLILYVLIQKKREKHTKILFHIPFSLCSHGQVHISYILNLYCNKPS